MGQGCNIVARNVQWNYIYCVSDTFVSPKYFNHVLLLYLSMYIWRWHNHGQCWLKRPYAIFKIIWSQVNRTSKTSLCAPLYKWCPWFWWYINLMVFDLDPEMIGNKFDQWCDVYLAMIPQHIQHMISISCQYHYEEAHFLDGSTLGGPVWLDLIHPYPIACTPNKTNGFDKNNLFNPTSLIRINFLITSWSSPSTHQNHPKPSSPHLMPNLNSKPLIKIKSPRGSQWN